MATLFVNSQLAVDLFERWYGVPSTVAFFDCADAQLTRFFITATGLKPGKHVCISWPFPEDFLYHKGAVSRMLVRIYVNHHWNPVTMLWKAQSGRIYTLDDTGIDCADLEFWLEGLDALLYHKQLYPNDTLPFKLKGLSYELEVTRLNMDCSLDLYLKEDRIEHSPAIISQIDAFIGAFNQKAGRHKTAPIHNWKRRTEGEKIVYEIDTGYAGPDLLRKLLPFLSKQAYYNKVVIW